VFGTLQQCLAESHVHRDVETLAKLGSIALRAPVI
jgi:hypothetical protein